MLIRMRMGWARVLRKFVGLAVVDWGKALDDPLTVDLAGAVQFFNLIKFVDIGQCPVEIAGGIAELGEDDNLLLVQVGVEP